jgi:LysM repeat protein
MSAQLGFWWLPALVSVVEQQNEERRHQEQMAAQAAEQRRAERKQTLQEERAKGEQLETEFASTLKELCKRWQQLEQRKKRGFNLDLLEQMDETHAAITKLRTDFKTWQDRKAALNSELASLGGDMTGTKPYTVKAGESLSIIAGRVYGNVMRWPDLAKLNPQVKITQNAQGIPISNLRPGDVILIPGPSTNTLPPPVPPGPSPAPVPVPSVPSDTGKEFLKENTSTKSGGGLGIVVAGLALGALGVAAVRNSKPKKKKRSRR